MAASRIGAAFGSVALVVAGTLVLSQAAPGTFADDLALDPSLATETVAVLESRTRSDVTAWVRGAWRGDLGRSFVTGRSVADLVANRAGNTLVLTVPATLLAWLVVAAHLTLRTRVSAVRRAVRDGSLALVQSIPDVVVGLCLIRIALATGWFPVGGAGAGSSSLVELVFDRARHAALPTVGLALTLVPALVRSVEAALAATADDVVLQAARARGLSERALRWRHHVRRAVPGLAPIVGTSTAALFGSGVVIETVFAWPGLGALLVDAVATRDLPVVLGAVVASAVLLVAANAAADAVAYLADPRRR